MKRSGIAVGCSSLLDFVVMFHGYDYISLFVSFFDIPVGFGNLFQRLSMIGFFCLLRKRLDIKSSFQLFLLDIMDVITRPRPIPINIDATNNRADVRRKMNPTPIPISVVPPMTHEPLSFFLSVLFILFSSFFTKYCNESVSGFHFGYSSTFQHNPKHK